MLTELLRSIRDPARRLKDCPACGAGLVDHTEQGGRRLFARAVGVTAQLKFCPTCGHKAFSPELPASLLSEIYCDPYFKSAQEEAAYRDQYARPQPPYIDFAQRIAEIAREFGLPADARIHEFGCGAGVTVHHLRAMGFRASGSDWSISAVRFAAEMGNIHVFREDMNVRDAFSGERLDMVLNLHAIEHVPRPCETLTSFAGLMDERTLLFLNTNQGDSITNRRFGMIFDTWYYFPQHLHYFSPRSFQAIAARAGLKVLDLRTSPRWFDQIEAAVGPPKRGETHAQRLRKVTEGFLNQEMEMVCAIEAAAWPAPDIRTPEPPAAEAAEPPAFDSHEDYFRTGGPWTAMAADRATSEWGPAMHFVGQHDYWQWDGAYVGDHWMRDVGGPWIPMWAFAAPTDGEWRFDVAAALTSLIEPAAELIVLRPPAPKQETAARGGEPTQVVPIDGLTPVRHELRTHLRRGERVGFAVRVAGFPNDQKVTLMVAARPQA